MRQGRVDTKLLDELLIAKGLTRKSLETELHFTETQVKSWFSTERRPQGGDALRIAHWLEVPPEVLCGLPMAEYVGLSAAQIASKASFDRFCKSDTRVRGSVRDILEQYANAAGAPKRSGEWSDLYEKVFVPATYFGHQQEKEAGRWCSVPLHDASSTRIPEPAGIMSNERQKPRPCRCSGANAARFFA